MTHLSSYRIALLVVLLTPVRLKVLGRNAPRVRWMLTAKLFWGLSPQVRIYDSSRRRAKKRDKAAPKRASQEVTRTRRVDGPRFVTAALKLIVEILRRVSIVRFRIDADLGLGDPAQTGQLFGFLAPVVYGGPRTSKISIDLRPDFVSARASGQIDIELSFVPAAFILPGVRFAWRAFGPQT